MAVTFADGYYIRHINVISLTDSVVTFAECVIQTTSKVYNGRLRFMLLSFPDS